MNKYDIKELKTQVKEVLEYSQGYHVNFDVLDQIMDNWATNKQWFIEHMNGELCYEWPEKVNITFTEAAKEQKFSEFVDWVEWNVCNRELTEYVRFEGADALFDNQVKENYLFGETSILQGTKFLRTFKHFIKDKSLLNEAQSAASRIIQTQKVEGILGFSVHPLDFLSVSENNHNWRSCHALDGEYRGGGLSYMQDTASAIIYIRSDDFAKLPHFSENIKWNDKKWRMMMYFSEGRDAVMLGRPYPYALDNITQIATTILKTIVPTISYDAWHDNMIKDVRDRIENNNFYDVCLAPYYYERGMLFPLSDIVKDAPNSCHYDDLLESSVYTPIYTTSCKDSSIFWRFTALGQTSFYLGASGKCLKCGGDIDERENGNLLCCNCYEDIYYSDDNRHTCEICEQSYYEDDMIQVGDEGTWLCSDCFDAHGFICWKCGNSYLVEERHKWEENDQLFDLCDWCYRDKLEKDKDEFKKIDFKNIKPIKVTLYDIKTGEQIMQIPANDIFTLTAE